MGVVIGAPLSDLITFEAANIWDKLLFLAEDFSIGSEKVALFVTE